MYRVFNPKTLQSLYQSPPEEIPRAGFGAEDEIRTRATFNSATPLAGEPLEPLGYFCIAAQTINLITTTI